MNKLKKTKTKAKPTKQSPNKSYEVLAVASPTYSEYFVQKIMISPSILEFGKT